MPQSLVQLRLSFLLHLTASLSSLRQQVRPHLFFFFAFRAVVNETSQRLQVRPYPGCLATPTPGYIFVAPAPKNLQLPMDQNPKP